MEDRGITIFRIRIDPSDRLTGRDPVARFYIYLTQIAINRQVVTMTNDYGIIIPRHHEHTRHLPIEYRTGIRPG